MSAADDPAPKRPRTEAAVGEADAAAAEAPVTPAERAGLANGDEPAVLDNGDQGGAADADAGPVGDEAAAALEEDDARREEALAGLLAVQGELEQVSAPAQAQTDAARNWAGICALLRSRQRGPTLIGGGR